MAHRCPRNRCSTRPASPATLVDSTLDVGAVPDGTSQCAGNERSLNQALSLPIVPATTTTTEHVHHDERPRIVDDHDDRAHDDNKRQHQHDDDGRTGDTRPIDYWPDGLGVSLAPSVLAFEPTPSIVSTLTIAAMPSPTSATARPAALR